MWWWVRVSLAVTWRERVRVSRRVENVESEVWGLVIRDLMEARISRGRSCLSLLAALTQSHAPSRDCSIEDYSVGSGLRLASD